MDLTSLTIWWFKEQQMKVKYVTSKIKTEVAHSKFKRHNRFVLTLIGIVKGTSFSDLIFLPLVFEMGRRYFHFLFFLILLWPVASPVNYQMPRFTIKSSLLSAQKRSACTAFWQKKSKVFSIRTQLDLSNFLLLLQLAEEAAEKEGRRNQWDTGGGTAKTRQK